MHKKTLFAASFCYAALPNVALALTPLETVVVTATKEAQQRGDLAESVQVFDAATISAISPSHPSEVLNRAAGVHINNLGGEGHMTAIRQPITTRGVYLYLEDGVPTRPSGFFNHNALYEVNIPQSGMLEVVKGPGTALYGSDAIGGMINAISKAPPSEARYTVNLEAGSDGWRRGLLSAGNSNDEQGFLVSINWTENEGYSDAADYSRGSLSGRWDISASDKLQLKTLLSYSNIDQNSVSSLEAYDYRHHGDKNLYQGGTAFREVESLRLSSEFALTLSEQSLLTLTPYYRDNSMDMAPSWMVSYDPNVLASEFQSYGLLNKFRHSLNDKVTVISGLDLDYTPASYQETAISHSLNGDIYTGYVVLDHKNYDFKATQTSVSPYLQIDAEASEQLKISLGLRYDYFTIAYRDQLPSNNPYSVFIPQLNRPVNHLRPDNQTARFEEWSPKLGVVYQLNDQHNSYFNYRHAFSIPSAGTLFRSGSTANSDDLQPIKANSTELGLRGQATDWLYYELAAYRMQIKDDLVTVIDGFTRNVYNAGKTTHQGVELSLQGQINAAWHYSLAYTRTSQRYDSFSYTCCFPSQNIDVSGNEVGKAPKTIANMTLSYSPHTLPGLRLEAEWSHMGGYYTDETNNGRYDGHDLYNLRINYQINEAVEIYARLQNITDVLYSSYTNSQVGDADISYRTGQPRSVYTGIKLVF
ncbi:TonB-dependent receptor [Dasania sp. GY-MA-18]|uniref:TonB-dependent receptor n=1 Tax=Dasania phycosphaerae TaxID=2950436 RepID=A0A9J6RI15_9GAMM|nr:MULTISPECIES: TonB-dependent receptor [Dasania]MCR8921427.1 TonB-dependent receptor [Dasania sp. GY-MA-18]MCZ0863855.1 TonB-dependent receptor [Dasania phycosphaerae]MCZ0867583.1 TonB-dependent receptor [Dasania phycosphaerae]